MIITQKTRYGMRAVFELSRRFGQGPAKIADIAQTQAIPHRFLEAILRELRRGGFVASRRGREGGYYLIPRPDDPNANTIVELLQGPIDPMQCAPGNGTKEADCPFYGGCVFQPMWEETREAVKEVHRRTTFGSLVARDKEQLVKAGGDWSI